MGSQVLTVTAGPPFTHILNLLIGFLIYEADCSFCLKNTIRKPEERAVKRGIFDDIGDAFENMGNSIKEAVDCKKESESCMGIPKCCGDLQCYYENGFGSGLVSDT